MTISIWWIRRDLRLQDNPALQAAGRNGVPVIPVFVIDKRLMKAGWNRRQRFLVAGLHDLRRQLKRLGSDLVIRQGEPLAELRKLLRETGAEGIFAEEDFSPYARKRDMQAIRELPLSLIRGLTIMHPDDVLKPDGSPYTVFTPFSRKWKSLPIMSQHPGAPISFIPAVKLPASVTLPQVDEVEGFPASSGEAGKRLDDFFKYRMGAYADDRNRLDLDGTSRLSPYLRFGLVSVINAVARLRTGEDDCPTAGKTTWLNELIWRDFYYSILYHFPRVKDESFNQKYKNIEWRNSVEDLRAWKTGQTGYPVVDAAMRQLAETGWMHNRARMITASFLTKDLLINWQEGERWFMEQLVDGDPAANNCGWQWAAGTGTDAVPYFRIFNPVTQSRAYDPSGTHIRTWLPELRGLPDEWLHEPWRMSAAQQKACGVILGKTYPTPIVEHSRARERALAAYRAVS